MNRLLQHFVASPTGAGDASPNVWTTNDFDDFSSQPNTSEYGFKSHVHEIVDPNKSNTEKKANSQEHDEDDVSSLFQTNSTVFSDLTANVQYQSKSTEANAIFQSESIPPADPISKIYDTVDLNEDSSPFQLEISTERTDTIPPGSWFSSEREEQCSNVDFPPRATEDDTFHIEHRNDSFQITKNSSTASELFAQTPLFRDKANIEKEPHSDLWDSRFASSSAHIIDSVREDFVVVTKPEAEDFTQVLDSVSHEVFIQREEIELSDPMYGQALSESESHDMTSKSREWKATEAAISASASQGSSEAIAVTSKGQLHLQDEADTINALHPRNTKNEHESIQMKKECPSEPIRDVITRLTEPYKKTIQRLHRENSQLVQQLADHAGAFAIMKRKMDELEAQISNYQSRERLLYTLLNSDSYSSFSRT